MSINDIITRGESNDIDNMAIELNNINSKYNSNYYLFIFILIFIIIGNSSFYFYNSGAFNNQFKDSPWWTLIYKYIIHGIGFYFLYSIYNTGESFIKYYKIYYKLTTNKAKSIKNIWYTTDELKNKNFKKYYGVYFYTYNKLVEEYNKLKKALSEAKKALAETDKAKTSENIKKYRLNIDTYLHADYLYRKDNDMKTFNEINEDMTSTLIQEKYDEIKKVEDKTKKSLYKTHIIFKILNYILFIIFINIIVSYITRIGYPIYGSTYVYNPLSTLNILNFNISKESPSKNLLCNIFNNIANFFGFNNVHIGLKGEMFDCYKLRKIPININSDNLNNYIKNLSKSNGWFKIIFFIISIKTIITSTIGTIWRLFITYICAIIILNPINALLLYFISYIPATPINFIDSNNSVIKYLGKYLKVSFIYRYLFRLSQGRVYSGNYFTGVIRRFATMGLDPWMMDSLFNSDCLQLVCNQGQSKKKIIENKENKEDIENYTILQKIIYYFKQILQFFNYLKPSKPSKHFYYYFRFFIISCIISLILVGFNYLNGNNSLFGELNMTIKTQVIVFPIILFIIIIILIILLCVNNKSIPGFSLVRKLLLVTLNNPIGFFFEKFNYLFKIKTKDNIIIDNYNKDDNDLINNSINRYIINDTNKDLSNDDFKKNVNKIMDLNNNDKTFYLFNWNNLFNLTNVLNKIKKDWKEINGNINNNDILTDSVKNQDPHTITNALLSDILITMDRDLFNSEKILSSSTNLWSKFNKIDLKCEANDTLLNKLGLGESIETNEAPHVQFLNYPSRCYYYIPKDINNDLLDSNNNNNNDLKNIETILLKKKNNNEIEEEEYNHRLNHAKKFNKYKTDKLPLSASLHGQKVNDWTQFYTGGPDLGGQKLVLASCNKNKHQVVIKHNVYSQLISNKLGTTEQFLCFEKYCNKPRCISATILNNNNENIINTKFNNLCPCSSEKVNNNNQNGGFLESMFKHDGYFPIFIISKDNKEEEIKDIEVNTFNSKIRIKGIDDEVDYTPNNLLMIVDEYKNNEKEYYDNKELYEKMLNAIDFYNKHKLQKGGTNNLSSSNKILTYKNIPIKIRKNNKDNYITDDGNLIGI